jgi:hypothetical protein
MKLIGGVLGAYNEPSQTEASGVWKLSEHYVYTTKSNFPRFNPENSFDLTKLSNSQTNLNGNQFVFSQDSSPTAISFKDDGTKMYIVGVANDRIYQYTLSTAWNVATATYDNISSANVNAQDGVMSDIQFKDDGTKVYLVGSNNKRAFQYSLSEAWNIGTLSYDNIASPNIAATGNGSMNVDSLIITPNGNVVFYSNDSDNKIIRHTLSGSWNIGTSTFGNDKITTDFIVHDRIQTIPIGTSLVIGDDGKKLYSIQEYTSYSFIILQTNLNSSWNILDMELGISKVSSNNKIYYNHNLGSVYNNEATLKLPIATKFPLDSTSVSDLYFKSDGTKLYVLQDRGSTGAVVEYDLPVAWELNPYSPYPGYKFEYFGYSYSPNWDGAQATFSGFYFKPDGTKLYAVARTDANVYQYSLQVPWKLSSAVFDGFTVNTPLSTPYDIYFKDDGTKMFISGTNAASATACTSIRQYNLSSAWNIASATSGGAVTTLTTTANSFNHVQGSSIAFKYDGTKLYVAGNNEIRQYAVANAWNTSTANLTLETSFNVVTGTVPTANSITAIDFNADGTKMFLLAANNQVLNQYTLGTAWNVATANSSGIKYSTTGLTDIYSSRGGLNWSYPNAFRFKPSGDKFYLQFNGLPIIYEVDTTL